VRTVLLVVAVVCFAVVALLGFGVFSGAHLLGWLGVGLAAFAGAFLTERLNL
jgi:hypothetical protein